MAKPDLSVNLAGIKLKNPLILASGTCGYGEEYSKLMDLNQLGAIITKTITLNPQAGNPVPRTAETPSGMLNSIGLQNVGIENFLEEKLPLLKKLTKTPVIVSIGGKTIEEYTELTNILNKIDGLTAIEVNISCPNIKMKEKKMFAQDAQATYEVSKQVSGISRYPVIIKLSPNVTDIVAIAKAAEKGGAAIISAVNTFYGMSIDITKRQPKLANIYGGLSGPAIKPIALKLVWEIARAVEIPVIGLGGIATAEDALEFIIAGATAICIGTANFVEPQSYKKITEGVTKYLQKEKIKKLSNLIGSL
jgi:dihydroorotate dehydrogenase (NAD+) catalytic subunit